MISGVLFDKGLLEVIGGSVLVEIASKGCQLLG